MAKPILRKRAVTLKKQEIKRQIVWKKFLADQKIDKTVENTARQRLLKLISSTPELKDYKLLISDSKTSSNKNILDIDYHESMHFLGHSFGLFTSQESIIVDKKHNCIVLKKEKLIVPFEYLKKSLTRPLEFLIADRGGFGGKLAINEGHKDGAKIVFKLMKELDVKVDNAELEHRQKFGELKVLFDHYTLPELIQMGVSRKLLAYKYSSKDLMRVRTRALKRT